MRRKGKAARFRFGDLTAYGVSQLVTAYLSGLIKAGTIQRSSTCEECGAAANRIHGHHEDYTKPLAVRWLCSKCHATAHRYDDSSMDRGALAVAQYLYASGPPRFYLARLRDWVAAGNRPPQSGEDAS